MSSPPPASEGPAEATPSIPSGPLLEPEGSAEEATLAGTVLSPPVSSYQVSGREHDERAYGPFFPILLIVLAGVAWAAFQCYQLVIEQQSLTTFYSNQSRVLEESNKLRTALEGITRETAVLASQGNPGAKLIIDELARRGVTITPNAAPPTPKTDK